MKRLLLPLLLFLFLETGLQAQYIGYRHIQVDSLEQVLATNPPKGKELMFAYKDLMKGYCGINIEKSIYYARKCLDVSLLIDSLSCVSVCYDFLGLNYMYTWQHDSAMVYYGKALEVTERMKAFPKKYNEKDIGRHFSNIFNNIGSNYQIQGKYYEAIEYYIKSLKFSEKYDFKSTQATTYAIIGLMYGNMGNYEQAKINIIKSERLAHEMNDSVEIFYTKALLSSVLLEQKDYDNALQNAEIAYAYYSSLPKEGEEKAAMLRVLSEIYLQGYGDLARAEEYARQSLKISDTLGLFATAISLDLLSRIQLKRKKWRRAKQIALQALAPDSESALTIDIYEVLLKACSHLGETAEVEAYFDKYRDLQASKANKDYQSAIGELEVKYETGKKELEIEQQKNIISRQNTQRNLLAAGVVVSIVFLVLLWYLFRLRTKRNHALAERNDALSEINATKDKFFSIVSHDLKSPAIAQREATQILVKNISQWDEATLSKHCNALLRSADNQVELLQNLLNWARMQTGHISYRPEPFDFIPEIHPDVLQIGKIAERKGVKLHTNMPDHLLVTGDANMLATVVRNLLTNAVKFTEAGGTVTLDVSPNDGDGRNAAGKDAAGKDAAGKDGACPVSTGYTVSVSDTGIGMSEELLRNLFRLDKSHSRKGTAKEEGSGLGLIVCKELLEKHGSALCVESEEGKGSRFWFSILSTNK